MQSPFDKIDFILQRPCNTQCQILAVLIMGRYRKEIVKIDCNATDIDLTVHFRLSLTLDSLAYAIRLLKTSTKPSKSVVEKLMEEIVDKSIADALVVYGTKFDWDAPVAKEDALTSHLENMSRIFLAVAHVMTVDPVGLSKIL